MKNIFILLFLSILLAFLACDKDDPTSPEEETGELLATETIGTSGGEIESDNFKLTIPAGALPASTELKLFVSMEEEPFDESAITEFYKIEGFPSDYSQPLKLRLKYQGTFANSGAIAFGEEAFISSLGETTMAFQLISAKDSSGYLTCSLPAPTGNGQIQSSILKNLQPQNGPVTINIQGVSGFTPFLTTEKHFKISSTDKTVSLQAAQNLGNFLDAAFDTLKNLGFQHETKRNWYASVTIRKLDDKVFGYSASSMLGDNYGYLEFNSKKINDLAAMRLTAGHEFFHLVQALYDNRNRYSKAKFSSDHFWLDEATAVWIEEKFTDQANFVSPIRSGNEMAPIDGMEKGAEEDAGKHGYGMSAVIKYLCNIHGEDILVEMYEKIYNGSNPVDAIESATEDPVLWYEKFLRQYVLGQIYNVQMALWVGNKSGEFDISSESDTVKNFSGSYPDLSAKLYQVKLNYANINNSAKLEFTADGGTNEVTVFKYKSGSLEYVDNYNEELTISDVRNLKDNGWHLLALITNSRSVSPYTSSTDIKLEIKLKTPVWEICYFYVECRGYYKKEYVNYPDSVVYEWSSLVPVFSGWTKGDFTGNTFFGAWDTTEATGWFDRGSLTVTLSESRDKITSFQITQTSGYIEGHVLEETWQDACSGVNVPWQYDSLWGPLFFKAEGSETCNHLTSVESIWEPSYIPILYTLQNYECNDRSEIEISFGKDDLNRKAVFKEKVRRRSIQHK